MTEMDEALTAARWDDEYRRGRYADAPPIPFVAQILAVLQRRRAVGAGLYVGCGNGRNYLALVEAGLTLYGLDLSAQALQMLATRQPTLAPYLICGDFRRFQCPRPISYLIAIQVFQHGSMADVTTYFERVRALLPPGGLFFLRVNSVATQILHVHSIVERTALGGITIRYHEGPKRDLPVHFYSREELEALASGAFRPIAEPHEDFTRRVAPQTGSWAQWEMIWERTAVTD